MIGNRTQSSFSHQLLVVLSAALAGLLPLQVLLAEELSGTTTWVKRVELSTPVAGVIIRVNAAAGQILKQGQVLLSLDPRPFEYRIRGLQAKIGKLQVLRDEMQAELKRAMELYERTLLSDHELELAKIDAVSADADYRLAQSQLSTAQLDKEYSTLRAPFDAVVLKRYAEKGQVVSSTELMPQVLFVLASSKKMKVLTMLDGNTLLGLKKGQAVKVQLGKLVFEGTISMLGLEPAADTDAYPLEVEFETSGRLVRAGRKVKLIL